MRRSLERFLFQIGSNVAEFDEDKPEDRYNRKKDHELPLLSFSCMATATNNFSDENKLGEGGFGPVYKVIPYRMTSKKWFLFFDFSVKNVNDKRNFHFVNEVFNKDLIHSLFTFSKILYKSIRLKFYKHWQPPKKFASISVNE